MSTYERFSCARVAVADGVAEVSLRARGKASTMGPDFWRDMPGLFRALHLDDAVRAVVLSGEGAGFSYGLDLPGMAPELGQYLVAGLGAAERARLLERIEEMQLAVTAVARCRKPVVAAIHGWCIGGGVDLITACDVRLASQDARFSVREVKLAMVPDVGTLARLPAIVGQGRARLLALTGDDFDAAKALAFGLVDELFADPAALTEGARALAARIAANPPLAVQGIKQVMNLQSEAAATESLRAAAWWNTAFLPSRDVGEAIAAFMAKRPARFDGT